MEARREPAERVLAAQSGRGGQEEVESKRREKNDCHEGRGKHPLVGQWESAITTSMRDEDWVQKWRHNWSRTDPCSETKHGTSPGPSSFIPVHHLGICHLPGINPSSGPDQDDRDDHDLMSTLKRIGRNNEETAPDYA
ncbi:hypothetical protein GE21DRAFT_8443 [Neurospora crassa]|uniref:Uncharacterized protein n=1 Tax=Neurospora crassa (strain ATCC 24698 / 74-OR23-1A / CBS 708.71 / DSM 1257 / FGSC 987) TaxID=367110 RepID=Q7RWA7_NEUCR|nr:hypothetical protein NCU07239 [Neurospora crassa OR74A]EAA26663.1 hypothetical protein NCU07239 [Neurospora crassa OR74A]KHE85726.1 hypothetical protein GE21DRAFT_8443 [Neurospora crassa]|eukprot:XP_955899.1 hypothetical protein NCU07239 [Neurospora crassa OR74A]